MISILMTTYNGEKFLAEQLDSLFAQTIQDFVLYIRDDNSVDSTLQIAESYAEKYPDRVVVSANAVNSGGAKHNFIRMMIEHADDYLMLCDQDDVWLRDKIERSLQKMRELEGVYGRDTPLLVHTDLCVVDAGLRVLSDSFCKAMNANYNRTRLRDQLIQNTLTGCTALYNRALSDLIYAEPPYMVMHDWWLMLVASAFGHIGHIAEPTIYYRQHAQNEIGAADVRTLRYKIHKLINYQEVRQAIRNTYPQAGSLLTLYRSSMRREQIELVETYCKIPGMNKFGRWRTICRLGVLKNGLARKLANFLFI